MESTTVVSTLCAIVIVVVVVGLCLWAYALDVVSRQRAAIHLLMREVSPLTQMRAMRVINDDWSEE